MSIEQKLLEKYKADISIERLKSFIWNETDDYEDLLKRYKLNIKISQALYPELSILEVSLRNSIDNMLKTFISETWLENEIQQQNLLYDFEHECLIKAYNDIKKNYQQEFITRGKIIANLNFGFWTSICSKKYNSKIWTKKGYFKNVFVNYPKEKQQQIHDISKKLYSIRMLRNRIFHYEPILRKQNNLLLKYNEILEILSYLPNNFPNLLKDTSNFLSIYDELISKTKC